MSIFEGYEASKVPSIKKDSYSKRETFASPLRVILADDKNDILPISFILQQNEG